MPKKRLTEEGVAKLKVPSTGTVDYYDAVMPGLVLRLNYGGRKSWRALFYVPSVVKSGKRKGQRISHADHARTRPPSHPQTQAGAREGPGVPRRPAAGAGAGRHWLVQGGGGELYQAPRREEGLRTQDNIKRLLAQPSSIRRGGTARSATSGAAMSSCCSTASRTSTVRGRPTWSWPSSAR